jgi:hypothetical protein
VSGPFELAKKAKLHGVIFQGGGEAWKALAFGRAFDLDAHLAFVLGSGFPQDRDSAQGLGVNTGNQERVATLQILPQLADLNFA